MKFWTSSNVVSMATLALAIITFFYLRETSKIRRISEKALQLDLEPKIFIENISSEVKPDYNKNSLEVSAIIKIKNAGKIEGIQFQAPYTLSSGNIKIEGVIGPVPYLFTTQGITYQTKFMSIDISKENMEIVKQSLQVKKPLIVPENFVPPVSLDISLNYLDKQNKEYKIPYSWTYLFHKNEWIFSEMHK